MLQPYDSNRPKAVIAKALDASTRRTATVRCMRWLATPLLAMTLLGLAACSSPTPSTPGEPADGAVSEPGVIGEEGGEAPVRGMPTMIPPGGGEEYFSITVEPTEDVGYPPPPTKTFEERQADAYPAPGEAPVDEEPEDGAETEGAEESGAGEEPGDADGSSDGDEGGDEG